MEWACGEEFWRWLPARDVIRRGLRGPEFGPDAGGGLEGPAPSSVFVQTIAFPSSIPAARTPVQHGIEGRQRRPHSQAGAAADAAAALYSI